MVPFTHLLHGPTTIKLWFYDVMCIGEIMETKRETILRTIIFIMLSTQGQCVDMINRHNYGFVLVPIKQIHFMTAEAKLIFYYKLPEKTVNVTVEPVNCTGRYQARQNMVACQRTEQLMRAFRTMKLQALMHLQQRLRDIFDIVHDLPRFDRQKRGFGASILGKITGLATQDDLNKVTEVMHHVERGIQRAADVWQTGTSHFMAAFNIEKERVNTIYSLLQLQRKSIREIHGELVSRYQTSTARVALLTHIVERIVAVNDHLMQIESLYFAIQMLNAGRIPHMLIHHETFAHALHRLNSHLQKNHPELSILYTELFYYYRYATFHSFRYNRHLAIIVHVPLTKNVLAFPFDVFQVQSFPMQSPTRVDEYLMLSTRIFAIAFNRDADFYFIIENYEEMAHSDVIDLRTSTLIPQQRSIMSCGLALVEGSLSDIKQFCRYYVVQAPIPKSIQKISDHVALLAGFESIFISCDGQNSTHKVLSNETQLILPLTCGCVLTADSHVLFDASLQCDNRLNVSEIFSPKYILNIPYISTFLSDDILKSIASDDSLNRSIPSIFPTLSIASKEYEAKLAIEAESRYDLEMVVNQTKDDKMVFSDLSNYLYNVLLKTHNMTVRLMSLTLSIGY